MAVTSPTPCAGCTALSPTLNSGAGTGGELGVNNAPGPYGRGDGRWVATGCDCGDGGADGGCRAGRRTRSGGPAGRLAPGLAPVAEPTPVPPAGPRARALDTG